MWFSASGSNCFLIDWERKLHAYPALSVSSRAAGHGQGLRRALVTMVLILASLNSVVAAAGPWRRARMLADLMEAGKPACGCPILGQVNFGSFNARTLLKVGLLVCLLGAALWSGDPPAAQGSARSRAMREISELIYETARPI